MLQQLCYSSKNENLAHIHICVQCQDKMDYLWQEYYSIFVLRRVSMHVIAKYNAVPLLIYIFFIKVILKVLNHNLRT